MSEPRSYSQGNIPFSWETKPGVPKASMAQSFRREHKIVPKLQPPPYTSEAARRFSKKGLNRIQEHDPFLEAYKQCTKTPKNAERNNKSLKTSIDERLKNSMTFISCRRSCPVLDNNFIRISHLPPNQDKD